MNKSLAVLAAIVLLIAAAAPVLADGRGYSHHGNRHGYLPYGGHYSSYRPHQRHRHYKSYGHRHRGHRHGYDDDGALIAGALVGGVVVGHLLTRPSPAPVYAPAPAFTQVPPQPLLGGCVQTTGTGTWYGRPAQFGGTMCYDRAGRAYIRNDSVRFLYYL